MLQYQFNKFYMICHSSFCAILYDANFKYISYIEQNFCESFEREKSFSPRQDQVFANFHVTCLVVRESVFVRLS